MDGLRAECLGSSVVQAGSSPKLLTLNPQPSTLNSHRSARELEDVEGSRRHAELFLCVADHDHAEGARDPDGVCPRFGDLLHSRLVDAGAELLFHPHPAAAGSAAEPALARTLELDAAQAGNRVKNSTGRIVDAV